jgi:2,4-diketo-3-deoxy-L-fuconate hydrolase
MRLANVDGRSVLVVDGGIVDVERASNGRFSSDPCHVYDDFEKLRAWASTVTGADQAFDEAAAGPPVPRPHQVFAVALNYAAHADESGFTPPSDPLIFTKYASAFSGPTSEVVLPAGGSTDWEVEVVAVMGRETVGVGVSDAWHAVAGLTVGQDLSDRVLQRSGPAPQYSLGKSRRGFAPTGPVVVSLDEIEHPDDLGLGCSVNGDVRQSSRTTKMIFAIPELVAYLSSIVTLYPGDLIFTGTPDGVGMGRDPQVYLAPGDRLDSWVEGVGELHQSFVADPRTQARAS